MIQSKRVNGCDILYEIYDPQVDEIFAGYEFGASIKRLGEITNSDAAVNFNFADTAQGFPIGRLIIDGRTVVQDIPKTAARDELFMLPDRSIHIGKAPTGAVWAIQGSPPLLRGGRNVVHEGIARDQLGADIWQRRALRTAVGITKDGMLTIVKTNTPVYLGEMADIMLYLGCVNALNGDGGGSSYFWPKDNGWGRKLGSALCIKRGGEEGMNHFEGYRVTSPFGWRKSPISGQQEFHTGVDLVKAHQAPIPAFVGGKVIHAKAGATGSGFGGYGIVVAVQDKYGALHCYCHLDSIAVAVGDVINAGQPVGRQGNTGQSNGSHLHYEIRKTTTPQYGWIADRPNNCYEPDKYLDDYFAKEIKEVKDDLPKAQSHATFQVEDGPGINTYIINGTMYAPVRQVAESLGAVVAEYDNEKKHAVIKLRG